LAGPKQYYAASLSDGSLTFLHIISPVGGLNATAYLEAYVGASHLLQPGFLDMSFLLRHQLQVVVWQ